MLSFRPLPLSLSHKGRGNVPVRPVETRNGTDRDSHFANDGDKADT